MSKNNVSLDSPEVENYLNNSLPSQPSMPEQPTPDASSDPLDSAAVENFVAPTTKKEKYGTSGQQAIAGLEGAGQGLLGPVIPAIEKDLGVKEEDILARKEVNPGTHLAGEAVGLIAPTILTAGGNLEARGALAAASKFTQAGLLEAIGKKIAIGGGETLASKIGTAAAKGAIENMLIAGSDEASKTILNDPNQSAETAVANVGLAGALGGALGGSMGAAGGLWDATVGSKAGKLVEDFKSRIKAHIDNPDPVHSVTEELGNYYKSMTGVADEVYGAQGIKAQDIGKALPERHEAMDHQVADIWNKAQKAIDNLGDDPLAKKLSKELDGFISKVRSVDETAATGVGAPGRSSADVFNAIQDFKQNLQAWSKFESPLNPIAERDFIKTTKGLSNELKSALEDTSVWGKAGQRQKAINSAFSEYLPKLKDFNKRFTVEINGERVIDPAKINTYVNQLDKPNAEIKKEMLKNFLDASEKYKKVIDESHINLGLEPPQINSPLNVTMSTLDKKTLGAQLADAFVDKGLKAAGGQGLASSAGAGLGALVGGPAGSVVGAILGGKVLGPLFSTVLPALSKSIVEGPTSSRGLKASVDYVMQVAKGTATTNKAIKNLFDFSPALGMNLKTPDEAELSKLDKKISALQQNPQPLFNQKNEVTKLMPNHGMAVDTTSANAMTYLNSLRPNTSRNSPLDSVPIPSSAQQATYKNALMIAQQPLLVLDKIKHGRLTTNDMAALSSMYPSIYKSLQGKILQGMNDSLTKGVAIPYRTRMSMSMFLAQPLDSTMTPSAIMATQGVSQTGKTLAASPQASKGVKSSPALQKMSGNFQTASQARQVRQQRQ